MNIDLVYHAFWSVSGGGADSGGIGFRCSINPTAAAMVLVELKVDGWIVFDFGAGENLLKTK